MITHDLKKTHTSSGVIETKDFGVKVENLATIFHILRNQLYKDPKMAVLREYACNAVDANVEAGNKDKPILVTLPSAFEPTLKIRDFGLGLSEDGIYNVYVSYGDSTKRNTNEAIGMLGLGSKSGFAYVDSFIITSYHGGKKTTYTAFIDPTRVGKVSKLAEEDSNEPTGIEVTVPVKNQDINSFYERARSLFLNFKVKPIIKGWGADWERSFQEHCDRKVEFSGAGWHYYGNNTGAFAIMGLIAYPLDESAFGANDLTSQMRTLIRHGIKIEFNIGDLEIAASREALQYTDKTRRAILAKFKEITGSLQKIVDDKVSECKSMWDAKLMWLTLNSHDSAFYKMRELVSSTVKWKGVEVANADYDFARYLIPPPQPAPVNGVKVTPSAPVPTEPAVKVSFFAKNGYSRVAGEQARYFRVNKDIMLVENDSKLENGLKNRIVPVIEEGKAKQVVLMQFRDAAARKEVLEGMGLDAPIVKISTLKAEPLRKYYGGLTTPVNKKHVSSEFEYDTSCNSRYGVKNSDFWKHVEVDPSSDSGFYVALDRFSFMDGSSSWRDARHLAAIIATAEAAGVKVGKVYGFKKDAINEAVKNPNMVNLFDHYKKELKKLVVNAAQSLHVFLDSERATNDRVANHYMTYFKHYEGLDAKIDEVKALLDAQKVTTAMKTLHGNLKNFASVLALDLVNLLPAFQGKRASDEVGKLSALYPFVTMVLKDLGGYRDQTYVQHFAEYIKMTNANKILAAKVASLQSKKANP